MLLRGFALNLINRDKTLPMAEVPGERVHGNRKAQSDYKIYTDKRYIDAGEGAYGHGVQGQWATGYKNARFNLNIAE